MHSWWAGKAGVFFFFFSVFSVSSVPILSLISSRSKYICVEKLIFNCNWPVLTKWKDWCRSWNSKTLATWCKELTHQKRPWCWERLRAGGEGDDRGWDCWMASPTWRTWVWESSGSWWWIGRPGVLQSMGSQNQTRLSDWTEPNGWLNGWKELYREDDPIAGMARVASMRK